MTGYDGVDGPDVRLHEASVAVRAPVPADGQGGAADGQRRVQRRTRGRLHPAQPRPPRHAVLRRHVTAGS